MPFCTHCGNQVGGTDVFCASCGTRQVPLGAAPPPGGKGAQDYFEGISPRTAAMTCYIPWVGWIPAIVYLALPRFQADRLVRFHAFQGLYLFVAWLLVDHVVEPFLHAIPSPAPFQTVAWLLHLLVLAGWGWMIIKTSQGEAYHLPVVGELAERSLAEQR